MRIQYCSDLHLELSENKELWLAQPIKPVAPILILAGDIMRFSDIGRNADVWDFLSKNFEQVFWIPGNHEYYHEDIEKRSGSFEEEIRPNVLLLNNKVKELDGNQLIFTTMWSHIPERERDYLQETFLDFQKIKQGKHGFQVDYFNTLFEQNKAFIETSLQQGDYAKRMVVTHHVPTLRRYPPKYAGTRSNPAFATDLDDFIKNSPIDYWLYGHHHYTAPSFQIGQTTMLTNQLGYVKYKEHALFDREAFIEL